MSCIIDDTFREQIAIFYYAHIRRVAQTLFSQGVMTVTVAKCLLLTTSQAVRWRELFEKGQLLKSGVDQSSINSPLPFANASDQYNWKNFAYDVKRSAKVFFDMGLRSRAVAIYLGVPTGTVSNWERLYKKNAFKIDHPIEKFPPLELTEEKFTIINNRKYYSFEIRSIAKQCFEKGFNTNEVAQYINVPKDTVYRWKCLFDNGRFYINEKEKELWRKSMNFPQKVYSFDDRRSVKECFLKGMTPYETAKYLNLPYQTILNWFSQFKENRFYVNAEEKKLYRKPYKRTQHSLEVKLTAKDLFEKGVNPKEVALILGVSKESAKYWNKQYKEGKFCVEAVRKQAYLKKLADEARKSNGKRLIRSYTDETRMAAKECFDQECSSIETAIRLGIPKSTARDWKHLYKNGQFLVGKKD